MPWKIQKIIAQLFKGAIKSNRNNYRPISLLSHFDWIFGEKIMQKTRYILGAKANILPPKRISTIVFCCNGVNWDYRQYQAPSWRKELCNRVFIDFKKTFDTVDHKIMLRKLDCYGIRGHANMLIRSCLIDRRQFTVANGVQSDIGFVKCGAPHGSVLGPLFSYYTLMIYAELLDVMLLDYLQMIPPYCHMGWIWML